jgi:hypothetical protein
VTDAGDFETLADVDHPLTPEDCAALARAAGELVSLDALDRGGTGSARLLWRNERSEAWLNTWWEPRDTGFHDHGGSCVGVYVLEGRARNEGLAVDGARRLREFGPGDTFAFPSSGIHRMEHDPGAVTIHVYAPPMREIGHYDVVDGELRREPRPPDEASPPSPGLAAVLRSD